MQEKKIKEFFRAIDYRIKVFNANKGFKVDSDSHSDWLTFDVRNIKWEKSGLSYLIQIFPHFNDREQIVSWTLISVVSYDTENDRYLTAFSAANEVTLDYIALNAVKLLDETYNRICEVKKDEMPFAVTLSKR